MDEGPCRHDLADEEWERLLPLLPVNARQGRRWVDHRTAINGILFRTRGGVTWRDVPVEYGRWKTVCQRHRRWSMDGTWQRVLGGLRAGCDGVEGEGWTVSVDSTVNRARQHAAGARHRPPLDGLAGG